MTRKERIYLKVSQNDEDEDEEIVAYLTLPDHPGPSSGVVRRNVRLRDLVGDYVGPDLFFDFDENNVLVGVEILD
jgi:hypothetical protein